MVQKAFVLYWGLSHLATFLLVALLVSHSVWASRIPAAGSMIARLTSNDWGGIDKVLIMLAIAHCAFYLGMPNFADYGEPTIYMEHQSIRTGIPVKRSSAATTALMSS